MPINPPNPIVPSTVDLNFGEWTPDTPDFSSAGSPMVLNAYPRTPTSYGPVGALTALGASALATACQGSVAVLDTSGNPYLFAGDAHDLYSLRSSGSSWVNVSKSAGVYNAPSDGFWNFEFFNNSIIATDFNDPPQTFTPGVSTLFADLGGSPPKARYIATVKNFLVLANTNDPIFGVQPKRVWWSGTGDATSWPTPGGVTAAQVQSSYNDILGRSGWVQGIVGNLGNADAAVFLEHAVYRMVYAGPPVVFDFFPCQGVKGTPAPGSIVQFGALAYYLGEDGFYAFDGLNSIPIGANKIDKTFYANVNQSRLNKVIGAPDPLNKMIWWAYPSLSSSGTPDTLIGYNWQLQRWCQVSQSVEVLTRLLTLGYTLDELYTILGYTIDGLPYGLDSRVWTGGLMTFGAFNTSNQLAYFSGPNMAATIETGEQQILPGQRTFISGARPWVDGGTGGASVTPAISMGVRDQLNAAVVYKTASAMNSFGTCPQRCSGRYARARMTTQAGDTWNHMIGTELDIRPVGMR